MELVVTKRYLDGVDSIDEASALLIARDLIAEHGDDVARVVQDKIDAYFESGDLEQFSKWFIIRNAVTLSLQSGTTLQ